MGQYNFKAQNWYGLDRFGNVFTSTDWKTGQNGIFMHYSCYINFSLQQYLNNAKKRYAKLTRIRIPSSPKLMRFSTGLIHDKALCIWCRKYMQAYATYI